MSCSAILSAIWLTLKALFSLVFGFVTKSQGVKFEKISEKAQEKELAKYTGHIDFLEGLNNVTTEVAIKQFTESKSEKALMTYVIETMLNAYFAHSGQGFGVELKSSG